MGSKDSLMHHNKACCCMLLWNLGSVQGRPGAQGFRKSFTSGRLCTRSIPVTCTRKQAAGPFCSRNINWWDFSLEQIRIFHENTSLDINKAKGMMTSNAKRSFCKNVTCFGTNKCCWDRSHLSGCFKCSSLLACKAPRVQLSIPFPICASRIHLAASLYQSPGDCFQEIMF